MTRKVKLLLSSAGRRVELIRCFRASASEIGLELEVHACDLAPELSSACHVADHSFRPPACTASNYAATLLEYCRSHGIRVLVPTIDPELEPLAHKEEAFRQAGIFLNLSSVEAIRTARSKSATAELLSRAGIRVPRTACLADEDAWSSWGTPLILKPNHGSASTGVHRCADAGDAKAWRQRGLQGDYIVQELIQGREYTVNCYFDRTGKLRSAVPHERIEVRAGEVSKGRTERDPLLLDLARRIGQDTELLLAGAVCFQVMIDTEGTPYVFEINARFGGGYPLAHHAGADHAKWLLQEATGQCPAYHENWRSGVVMLRYDASIFA